MAIPAISDPSTTWNGGSGNWDDPTKWSGGVPNSTTSAFIDGGKAIASPVTLDISGAQVGNLTIDSDDSLNFNGNTTLTVNGGTISNTGKIVINSGGATNSQLFFGASTTLQGGDTVTLNTTTSGGGAAFIQGNGFTLTNTNNTVQGDGIIGNGTLKVINQGMISANSTGGAQSNSLSLNGTGGLTNSGTLSVSASDFMHVSGGPFTNFAGATLTGGTYNVTGTLEIDELGSTGGEILTNAANVILNTPASRFIDAGDENVLSKLNANAAGSSLTITGGQNFTTAGNFTNNGTLTVGASTSKFDVNGNLTNFSGTTLTGGTYNVVGMLQFNGANIVTNAANITLTGPSSQIINQSSANGSLTMSPARFNSMAPTSSPTPPTSPYPGLPPRY